MNAEEVAEIMLSPWKAGAEHRRVVDRGEAYNPERYRVEGYYFSTWQYERDFPDFEKALAFLEAEPVVLAVKKHGQVKVKEGTSDADRSRKTREEFAREARLNSDCRCSPERLVDRIKGLLGL